MKYETVDQDGAYYLLKNPESDKYTVVEKKGDGIAADVFSVMPGDMPSGGGKWTARWGTKGVDYVASWWSYSWARTVFNRKTADDSWG